MYMYVTIASLTWSIHIPAHVHIWSPCCLFSCLHCWLAFYPSCHFHMKLIGSIMRFRALFPSCMLGWPTVLTSTDKALLVSMRPILTIVAVTLILSTFLISIAVLVAVLIPWLSWIWVVSTICKILVLLLVVRTLILLVLCLILALNLFVCDDTWS